MTRRLPIFPTLIVGAAVAVMIALGIWQLERKHWKDGLVARYQAAQSMSSDVSWPRSRVEVEAALYRRAHVSCDEVVSMSAIAGRSVQGQAGWAHVASCQLDSGALADIALGWSAEPGEVTWSGGEVSGFIGPAGEGARLIAAPPQAGLVQLGAPDPLDVPNNHLSYAVQWFFFATTALVIYLLALRKRWREANGGKRR